jgi:ABC-type glycerol-3-phosphate transport system permease component
MNRAFLIIFIPAILVVIGYILVLRAMGLAIGYPRLILALAIVLVAVYWLLRKRVGRGAKGGE